MNPTHDWWRLTTLFVNVVRRDTNQQWRKALTDFVSEDLLEEYDEFDAEEYIWSDFQMWIRHRFGYNPRDHVLIFAQYAMNDPRTRVVRDAHTWEKLLYDIVTSSETVLGSSDLYFLVVPRRHPRVLKPTMTMRIMNQERHRQQAALETEETDEYSGDDTTVYEAEVAQSIKFVYAEEATSQTPQARTPSPPSPVINSTPASTYLNLISDLSASYSTTSHADADYGAPAAHLTLDTSLGGYNHTFSSYSSQTTAWHACLDFFNIPLATYLQHSKPTTTTGTATGTGADAARKRVPLKRLPGMSIGLFDYQLMGVFTLLRFVLRDVSGGLLCDEQGLGKTQEVYGLAALAWGLRRCRAEVRAFWRKQTQQQQQDGGKGLKGGRVGGRHHLPGEVGAGRACPFDERYGFRCYCYCEVTRELADRLPEGPNVVVAPARGCAAMVRDAKAKLDGKVFKIRGAFEGSDKEDKLTAADVGVLRATVTATKGKDSTVFQYQAGAGQGDYIIFVSPESVPRLNSQVAVEVTVANSTDKVKKSALLPGMVLMDEFHEYAIDDKSRTVAWLQHLKKCCLDSQQPTPLAYFVSGTPFGDTPADIRTALAFLEKEVWQGGTHPLNGATLGVFDDLTSTFDRLTALQASGEVVSQAEIADYRRRLDRVLQHTMVRRLGTDQFQGRNLTDIGPLKVNITDHRLPFSMTDGLQALANQTRDLATQAAAAQNIPLPRLLRSKAGEALLLKLRLASTFPALAASPSAAPFTFTLSELHTHLTAANNDVTKTPYFPHIPAWSASSPKLSTLRQTLTTMLADRTPIPGSPSPAKKACIFSPLESESLLIFGYLLHLKSTSPTFKLLKPVLLHSTLPPTARQRVLDAFLTEGNAAPNVLVAPMALAGTGLNLQRARYSVVTGPAWTKRENQQAYYRIHRVGQRMETRLGLLTGRWNPAERIVLGGYEGRVVVEEEGGWEVGNRFCDDGEEAE
ncbi:hypothetical protein NEMBOFW57_010329 [Staphylotrichum longicolle]|uniref:Helicase C-terminal domain-containing protein n=1 Tax=Staphylotrichum longicolle TaxID=669026 RepID=A0AAD4EMW0_9PEZI|nr:hypothetical protein NEMBOFW57_010329 [Staphylotrichum longicolle]